MNLSPAPKPHRQHRPSRALYTTARDATGCTKIMTGYIESIDGTITLSPSAARGVNAAAG